MIINKCQLCNGKLYKIFSLGKQPLCDDLIKIGCKKKINFIKLTLFFVKIALLLIISI